MKTLSDEQFQETVLRGVNAVEEKFQAVERNQETLLKNYEQLGRETKQTMEEMTPSISVLTSLSLVCEEKRGLGIFTEITQTRPSLTSSPVSAGSLSLRILLTLAY